ncbi:MAG TPA: hypothetical protein VII13_09465 [Vicinamibacteria bacterium]|jgi:hypothetical protein
MDNEALVKIFLAVIALGALLQAVLVAGLAFGARALRGRLGDLEDLVEREVMTRLHEAAGVAAQVADASEAALDEATRIAEVVAESATRISTALGDVADRVGGAAEATAHRIEQALDAGARAAEEPTRRTRAFWRGVRRGWDVWRQGDRPPRDY